MKGWKARFGESPETRTPTVVQQLLQRVPALRQRRVLDAFRATSVAVMLAGDLDLKKHKPEHVETARGQAFWEHASVLAALGRYPEALRFAERAEHTFAQIDTVVFGVERLAALKASLVAETGGSGTGPGDPRVGAGLHANGY